MLGKDETDRMQGHLSACSRVVTALNESVSSTTCKRRRGQQLETVQIVEVMKAGKRAAKASSGAFIGADF